MLQQHSPGQLGWGKGESHSHGDEGPSSALPPLLLWGLQADGLSPVPGRALGTAAQGIAGLTLLSSWLGGQVSAST